MSIDASTQLKLVRSISLLTMSLATVCVETIYARPRLCISLAATLIVTARDKTVRAAVLSSVRDIFSALVWTGANHHRSQGVVRSLFRETPFIPMKPSRNHTHGPSAADRSSFGTFATLYSGQLGMTCFFLQYSAGDVRNGRAGNRSYYWSKDLSVPPCDLPPPPNSIRCLTDVDHYLDMPHILSTDPAIYLIYTFQPHSASHISSDYSYTFMSSGEVLYSVSGGGQFQHHVWNYAVDSFIATSYRFGIPWTTTTYLVDRFTTSANHEVILLTPQLTGRFFISYLMTFLSSTTLALLNPVEGDFIRLDLLNPHSTSTCRVGSYLCATIPRDLDDAVAETAAVSKNDLMAPSVQSLLRDFLKDNLAEEQLRAMALVLTSYHRTKARAPRPLVCPAPHTGPAVHRVQHGQFDPDAKPVMVPFMDPIIDGAFSFDKSVGNTQRAVVSRVLEPANTKPLDSFTPRILPDFLDYLFPTPHMLTPLSLDEVYERQPRPSQRHIFEQGLYQEDTEVKAGIFIKSETYGKAGNPRIITTSAPDVKINESRYTYALAEYVKRFPWYAFGRAPRDIAERVADICQASSLVVLSDFSTMDGTIGQPQRYVERSVLTRAFHPTTHDDLLELYNNTFGGRASCADGVSYIRGTERGSGYPDTSILNTIDNAFNIYRAIRRTPHPSGGYYTHLDAVNTLERLASLAGDDGLVGNTCATALETSSSELGFIVKAEVVQRGGVGVTFLARMYGPNVWYGDYNSTMDYKRQLTKLHTTVTLPPGTTAETKLIEKCLGYATTDLLSPVIGPYLMAVLARDAGQRSPHADLIRPYNSDLPLDVQYPNEACDWMFPEFQRQLPEFDVPTFFAWLSEAPPGPEGLAYLMHCPIIHPRIEPNNKVPVIIDDELTTTAETSSIPDFTPVIRASNKARQDTVPKPRRKPTTRSRAFVNAKGSILDAILPNLFVQLAQVPCVITVTCLLFGLYGFMLPFIPSYFTAFTCVTLINVVAEETVKAYIPGPSAHLNFAVFEFFLYASQLQAPLPLILLYRLPAFLMHLTTGSMTLPAAVALHFAFNYFVAPLINLFWGDAPSHLFASISNFTMPTRKKTPAVSTATPRRVLRGKGDYSEAITKIPQILPRIEGKLDHLERVVNSSSSGVKGVAGSIGKTLGGLLGQPGLGQMAGEGLAKLFGHGDYNIKGNSLMAVSGMHVSSPGGPMPPVFSRDGRRGFRVTEREYIGEVVAGQSDGFATVFKNGVYPINPMAPITFPWLSTIAGRFDQWEPHGIVFEFNTTSSDFNGAGQSLGSVFMATNYDVSTPFYSSKRQMENADYACSTKPSVDLLHGVECDPAERPTRLLYTSDNGSADRIATLGNFQIATQGCNASNVVLGELWVSYDITFYKKQLTDPLSDNPYFEATGQQPVDTWAFYGVTNERAHLISLQNDTSSGEVLFATSVATGRFLCIHYMSDYRTSDQIQPTTFTLMNFIAGGPTVPDNSAHVGMSAWLVDIVNPYGGVPSMNFTVPKHTADASWVFTICAVPPDFTFEPPPV